MDGHVGESSPHPKAWGCRTKGAFLCMDVPASLNPTGRPVPPMCSKLGWSLQQQPLDVAQTRVESPSPQPLPPLPWAVPSLCPPQPAAPPCQLLTHRTHIWGLPPAPHARGRCASAAPTMANIPQAPCPAPLGSPGSHQGHPSLVTPPRSVPPSPPRSHQGRPPAASLHLPGALRCPEPTLCPILPLSSPPHRCHPFPVLSALPGDPRCPIPPPLCAPTAATPPRSPRPLPVPSGAAVPPVGAILSPCIPDPPGAPWPPPPVPPALPGVSSPLRPPPVPPVPPGLPPCPVPPGAPSPPRRPPRSLTAAWNRLRPLRPPRRAAGEGRGGSGAGSNRGVRGVPGLGGSRGRAGRAPSAAPRRSARRPHGRDREIAAAPAAPRVGGPGGGSRGCRPRRARGRGGSGGGGSTGPPSSLSPLPEQRERRPARQRRGSRSPGRERAGHAWHGGVRERGRSPRRGRGARCWRGRPESPLAASPVSVTTGEGAGMLRVPAPLSRQCPPVPEPLTEGWHSVSPARTHCHQWAPGGAATTRPDGEFSGGLGGCWSSLPAVLGSLPWEGARGGCHGPHPGPALRGSVLFIPRPAPGVGPEPPPRDPARAGGAVPVAGAHPRSYRGSSRGIPQGHGAHSGVLPQPSRFTPLPTAPLSRPPSPPFFPFPRASVRRGGAVPSPGAAPG